MLLLSGAPLHAQQRTAPEKFAGTYRIAQWKSLQGKQLFHFFYLHPSGMFLLAAEWPGVETSRAVGEWYVAGDRLHLGRQARVETNQGN